MPNTSLRAQFLSEMVAESQANLVECDAQAQLTRKHLTNFRCLLGDQLFH